MSPDGHRSLLFRTALALLAVQLIVILIGAWWLWPYARTHIEERELRDVASVAGQLAPGYAELLTESTVEGDIGVLGDAVRRDALLLGARVTLFSGEDTVLVDSAPSDSQLDRPWRRPEVARAMRDGSSTLLRSDVVTDEPTTYGAVRLTAEGDSSVTLRVGRSITEEYAWLNNAFRTGILLGIALMLLTAGGFMIASAQLRKRVSSVTGKMSELASGNLRTKFAPLHDAEFAPITKSLNTLTSRLAERMDQIQAQQNMHQAILQSMGSAVIALDLEQRILEMNHAAERMLSCDAEESRGRLLHEVVLNARLHRYVAEAMADSALPPIEFSIDPHGQTKIEADSEQLVSAEGRPRGLLVILSDVTRLRRLESLRSDFAANVSHELRTPITNIKGYVETLLDVGLEDNAQALRFLEIVNKNSSRLAAIIDDVMTLTKLEQPHARDTLDKSLRPASTIVRSVVGQFERLAEAKKIALREQVPADMRLVVHGPLIEQAIGNLVSNAINYSPANTVVTISAEMRNGHVEISVADQGPGIAPSHQERLFERFYRVDKARSRELGGTGLGLALVKHIALAHGGNVTVRSDIGKGSVFTLEIPSP